MRTICRKSPVSEFLMVEFTLPRNSKVKKGKVWPADKAANGKKPKRSKEFKVYRYNPDSGGNPTRRHLYGRSGQLRPDGPGRADQDQERDRSRPWPSAAPAAKACAAPAP